MRRNNYKWSFAALLCATTLCNTGCSDQFLEDKKLYGTYNEGTVYNNYETAVNRIDRIYYQLYPGQREGTGRYSALISTGTDDVWAKTTEEYPGLSKWEDNLQVLDYGDTEDHFYVENKEISPYGHVREINEAIESLKKSTLPQEQINGLLGQAYFFRAWRYYLMVRWYGGVPIIDHVQEALVGNGEGLDLVVPRASTKECIDFICADLDLAASLLPAAWENADKDFGRVTAGTALALKGRILNLFASPVFNRANKIERWEAAYDANKAALDKLAEGGFGLAYENNAGSEKQSAKNWATIFTNNRGTDGTVNEAVFVTLYNQVESEVERKWNGWEQSIRPSNTLGGGGKFPTAEMVDLFPMADGKKPGESELTYDPLCFFADRDPRFYHTFAFPGVQWRFNGNPKSDLTVTDDEHQFDGGETFREDYPWNGNEYVLWSYTFYRSDADKYDLSKSGYGADGLKSMSNKSSVYVRKRWDVQNGNYNYSSSGSYTGFERCSAPYMEIRFAEVLLNFAESAAALGHDAEAIEALRRIRSRVYDAKYAPDFGLNPSMTDGELMAAILYERQIELAYEGKRFEDMRRWMLFDGGTGTVPGAPDSWVLTGWGGNTCAYLGVAPANGRSKHHMIEIVVKEVAAAENFASDPLLNSVNRKNLCNGLNLDDRFKGNNQGEGKLKELYTNYFERKDKSAEGNNLEQVPTWDPRFYIMGLCNSAMVNNPTLYQNIGWTDVMHGGQGIYDPLEEDPDKIPVDTNTGYVIN